MTILLDLEDNNLELISYLFKEGKAIAIEAGIGAIIASSLSLMLLPPLILGGIIGAIIPIMITTVWILLQDQEQDKIEGWTASNLISIEHVYLLGMCIISIAIGSFLFHMGIMLVAFLFPIITSQIVLVGLIALIGSIIGVVAPILGFLISISIIQPIAKKINKSIREEDRQEDTFTVLSIR